MTEPLTFMDAEAYTGKKGLDEPLTIQLIILQHLQRITRLASTEFHGGFWYEVGYQMGGAVPVKRYMPAANEAYSNAVDCFADLLAPYFDEEMQRADDAHEQACNTAKQELKEEQGGSVEKTVWYMVKVRLKRKHFRELTRFLARSGLVENNGGNMPDDEVLV